MVLECTFKYFKSMLAQRLISRMEWGVRSLSGGIVKNGTTRGKQERRLEGPQGSLGLDRAKLLVKRHEIEVIPRFDYQAVFDSDNGNSGKFYGVLRGCEPQRVTAMLSSH